MKIIWEAGDNTEVEDNTAVPHNLAAAYVYLLEDLGNGNWKVEVEDSWDDATPIGTVVELNEKWFTE